MSATYGLALVPDLQAFKDLISTGLNFKEVSILAPLALVQERPSGFEPFGKVITVNDYLDCGQVESAIYQEFQRSPFTYLIAIQEIDILRAGRLRTLLNLPGQSYESAQAFRDKIIMKELLHQKGIKAPSFQRVKSPADILEFLTHHPFPVILKPTLGTGSHGVTVLHSKQQAMDYLTKGHHFMANQTVDLHIEEFIDGTMYHVNGIVCDGQIVACWPSVYPQPSIAMQQGKYAASYLLDQTNPLVVRLNDYAHRVLAALPSPMNTVFHLEVFVKPSQEIIFCEIASRIGGKGVRSSWQESFEINLGKFFIESQTDKIHSPVTTTGSLQPKILTGEIWFPILPGKLEGIEKHCPFPWVQDYQIFYQPGDTIHGQAQDVNECLAGIQLLTADNEIEMQHRMDEIVAWFTTKTTWS